LAVSLPVLNTRAPPSRTNHTGATIGRPLALLLAMAARRWSARFLVSAALLAVVLIAGYRIQPPWWDTAPDIQEMSSAMSDGTGYEGADEYVPARADPYDVDKSLPRITGDSGEPVRAKIQTWGPEEKHFAEGLQKSLPAGGAGELDSTASIRPLRKPDPNEAAEFVKATQVDALAIAIGTSHGAYKFTRPPTGERASCPAESGDLFPAASICSMRRGSPR
jgi:hypothetical protein